MRIISGKLKGRRIQAPKKLPVRPTTDMAKESLFNILNNHYYFESISVLDLFSGTGNISYEFGSRGTENIVAIDKSYHCVKFIQNTAQNFGLPIQVYKSDVFSFLENTQFQFDLIFADPPYNWETAEFLKIVDLVFSRNLLQDEGMLILEHSKHTDLSNHPAYTYSKKYGGNVFSFFEV